MNFLPYIEGKEPYMPPSGTECVTFFLDAGDVPIFGIATYLKKGEEVVDFVRNFKGSEDLTPEERILASLFSDDAKRVIEESGFYTLEEDEKGDIRNVKVPDPVTHWAFLEIPLATGNPFVDACAEERMGILNTLENMLRMLDTFERKGFSSKEQILALKEWTKGVVCDLQNGSKERARIVSRYQ